MFDLYVDLSLVVLMLILVVYLETYFLFYYSYNLLCLKCNNINDFFLCQ